MLSLRVPLILASASPRRRDLLSRLGLDVDVRPTDTDETWPDGLDPSRAVEALADRKARAIRAPDALVLAADTIVWHRGDVLGKPASPGRAREVLRRLSGQTHTVYTGLALHFGDRQSTAHEVTSVTFADLSDDEIDAYVATGSPMDKAGAYGIQDDLGALLVRGIEGDYSNVVGLPLRCMYETLREDFPDLMA